MSEKKPNIFVRIGKFFRECRSEVRKIVWPTPKSVWKNLGVVLLVILIIGLFIFGFDALMHFLLSKVMNLA